MNTTTKTARRYNKSEIVTGCFGRPEFRAFFAAEWGQHGSAVINAPVNDGERTALSFARIDVGILVIGTRGDCCPTLAITDARRLWADARAAGVVCVFEG